MSIEISAAAWLSGEPCTHILNINGGSQHVFSACSGPFSALVCCVQLNKLAELPALAEAMWPWKEGPGQSDN